MTEFAQSPEAELERRRALAVRVRRELESAGLPALDRSRSTSAPGAVVDVDPMNDDLGGVTISWNADRELTTVATDAMLELRFDDPAIRRIAEIDQFMSTAILGILQSAGFPAEIGLNDLSPTTVYVRTDAGKVSDSSH